MEDPIPGEPLPPGPPIATLNASRAPEIPLQSTKQGPDNIGDTIVAEVPQEQEKEPHEQDTGPQAQEMIPDILLEQEGIAHRYGRTQHSFITYI